MGKNPFLEPRLGGCWIFFSLVHHGFIELIQSPFPWRYLLEAYAQLSNGHTSPAWSLTAQEVPSSIGKGTPFNQLT